MSNQFRGEERRRWVRVGTLQGAGRGMILSVIYMCLPILISVLTGLGWAVTDLNASSTGGTSELLTDPTAVLGGAAGILFVGIFYLIFGVGIGVVPATIIGAVTGALLGAALSLPHIAPYRWNRIGVGTGIAFIIAAFVSQVAIHLFADGAPTDWGPYLFFLGVPTLVYLATCVWLSDRLPVLVASDARVIEFSVRARLNTPAKGE